MPCAAPGKQCLASEMPGIKKKGKMSATAPIVLSARHALGQLRSEESLVLLLESTAYNDFNKEVSKYRVLLKYAVCFEIPLLGRKGKLYIHFFLDKETQKLFCGLLIIIYL